MTQAEFDETIDFIYDKMSFISACLHIICSAETLSQDCICQMLKQLANEVDNTVKRLDELTFVDVKETGRRDL